MLILQTQAKWPCVIVKVTSHVTYEYVIGINHVAYIYRVISGHRNWQMESAAWNLDLRYMSEETLYTLRNSCLETHWLGQFGGSTEMTLYVIGMSHVTNEYYILIITTLDL